VTGLSRRVREARRLGASAVIVPAAGELDEVAGVTVYRCQSLAQAIASAKIGTK
jgi:predicted ATP-dependent serine protease